MSKCRHWAKEVSTLGLCYRIIISNLSIVERSFFFFFFFNVLAVLGHFKILGTTRDYSFAFCINFVGRCKENSITKNCNSVSCIINTRLHLMFLHFKDVCYLHALELWLFVFYIQSRWWRVFHKGESFESENIIWMSYKLIVFKTEYYCWSLYCALSKLSSVNES